MISDEEKYLIVDTLEKEMLNNFIHVRKILKDLTDEKKLHSKNIKFLSEEIKFH